MLFLSKTILKNSLLLLKGPILAVLAKGEDFPDFHQKSFITSTTDLWKEVQESFEVVGN